MTETDTPASDIGTATGLYRTRSADRRHQGPARADRRPVEPAQVRGQAGQPREPPQAQRHHRRDRPGRRVRRSDPRRGGVPGDLVLLPGLAASRALHRGAGRHQRGEELQGRRRLGLPAVLRHREGRRLPIAGVQRLPAGRGQRQHHRPVRRAGRPLRARVRRPARQPLVRRRPGVADLLRARPDRAAAAHRRVPGPGAADRRGPAADVHPARDARARRRRRPGPWRHRARHGDRRDRDPPRRRRRPRERRLRQRLLPLHQRDGLQRHGDVARAPQGRLLRQPVLHADPPDLHTGRRRAPGRSSR